ncbi:uncharacterized protein LOC142229202 [Haematobia irritans]|uniref:uncharacterized protein LOC142229202 n=1 Tax=Haematobia irritans TaxID=7368 RepID=UPI003F4F7EFD
MSQNTRPQVPEGLRDLIKDFTREILREKPNNIYGFAEKYFEYLTEKENYNVNSFENPPDKHNSVYLPKSQQYHVTTTLAYSIVPKDLTVLIKDLIKAILKEQPKNLCEFAIEYFSRLRKSKMSSESNVTSFSSFENYFTNMDRLVYNLFVKCPCGRTFAEGYLANQNHEHLIPTSQTGKLNASSMASSPPLTNECTSTNSHKRTISYSEEYIESIYIIQRYIRRFLKRKKKMKKLGEGAVKLPMSEEKAALVIQRSVKKLFSNKLQNRTSETVADSLQVIPQLQLHQLENDNISETASYTSASTVALSASESSREILDFSVVENIVKEPIIENEELENDHQNVINCAPLQNSANSDINNKLSVNDNGNHILVSNDSFTPDTTHVIDESEHIFAKKPHLSEAISNIGEPSTFVFQEVLAKGVLNANFDAVSQSSKKVDAGNIKIDTYTNIEETSNDNFDSPYEVTSGGKHDEATELGTLIQYNEHTKDNNNGKFVPSAISLNEEFGKYESIENQDTMVDTDNERHVETPYNDPNFDDAHLSSDETMVHEKNSKTLQSTSSDTGIDYNLGFAPDYVLSNITEENIDDFIPSKVCQININSEALKKLPEETEMETYSVLKKQITEENAKDFLVVDENEKSAIGLYLSEGMPFIKKDSELGIQHVNLFNGSKESPLQLEDQSNNSLKELHEMGALVDDARREMDSNQIGENLSTAEYVVGTVEKGCNDGGDNEIPSTVVNVNNSSLTLPTDNNRQTETFDNDGKGVEEEKANKIPTNAANLNFRPSEQIIQKNHGIAVQEDIDSEISCGNYNNRQTETFDNDEKGVEEEKADKIPTNAANLNFRPSEQIIQKNHGIAVQEDVDSEISCGNDVLNSFSSVKLTNQENIPPKEEIVQDNINNKSILTDPDDHVIKQNRVDGEAMVCDSDKECSSTSKETHSEFEEIQKFYDGINGRKKASINSNADGNNNKKDMEEETTVSALNDKSSIVIVEENYKKEGQEDGDNANACRCDIENSTELISTDQNPRKTENYVTESDAIDLKSVKEDKTSIVAVNFNDNSLAISTDGSGETDGHEERTNYTYVCDIENSTELVSADHSPRKTENYGTESDAIDLKSVKENKTTIVAVNLNDNSLVISTDGTGETNDQEERINYTNIYEGDIRSSHFMPRVPSELEEILDNVNETSLEVPSNENQGRDDHGESKESQNEEIKMSNNGVSVRKIPSIDSDADCNSNKKELEEKNTAYTLKDKFSTVIIEVNHENEVQGGDHGKSKETHNEEIKMCDDDVSGRKIQSINSDADCNSIKMDVEDETAVSNLNDKPSIVITEVNHEKEGQGDVHYTNACRSDIENSTELISVDHSPRKTENYGTESNEIDLKDVNKDKTSIVVVNLNDNSLAISTDGRGETNEHEEGINYTNECGNDIRSSHSTPSVPNELNETEMSHSDVYGGKVLLIDSDKKRLGKEEVEISSNIHVNMNDAMSRATTEKNDGNEGFQYVHSEQPYANGIENHANSEHDQEIHNLNSCDNCKEISLVPSDNKLDKQANKIKFELYHDNVSDKEAIIEEESSFQAHTKSQNTLLSDPTGKIVNTNQHGIHINNEIVQDRFEQTKSSKDINSNDKANTSSSIGNNAGESSAIGQNDESHYDTLCNEVISEGMTYSKENVAGDKNTPKEEYNDDTPKEEYNDDTFNDTDCEIAAKEPSLIETSFKRVESNEKVPVADAITAITKGIAEGAMIVDDPSKRKFTHSMIEHSDQMDISSDSNEKTKGTAGQGIMQNVSWKNSEETILNERKNYDLHVPIDINNDELSMILKKQNVEKIKESKDEESATDDTLTSPSFEGTRKKRDIESTINSDSNTFETDFGPKLKPMGGLTEDRKHISKLEKCFPNSGNMDDDIEALEQEPKSKDGEKGRIKPSIGIYENVLLTTNETNETASSSNTIETLSTQIYTNKLEDGIKHSKVHSHTEFTTNPSNDSKELLKDVYNGDSDNIRTNTEHLCIMDMECETNTKLPEKRLEEVVINEDNLKCSTSKQVIQKTDVSDNCSNLVPIHNNPTTNDHSLLSKKHNEKINDVPDTETITYKGRNMSNDIDETLVAASEDSKCKQDGYVKNEKYQHTKIEDISDEETPNDENKSSSIPQTGSKILQIEDSNVNKYTFGTQDDESRVNVKGEQINFADTNIGNPNLLTDGNIARRNGLLERFSAQIFAETHLRSFWKENQMNNSTPLESYFPGKEVESSKQDILPDELESQSPKENQAYEKGNTTLDDHSNEDIEANNYTKELGIEGNQSHNMGNVDDTIISQCNVSNLEENDTSKQYNFSKNIDEERIPRYFYGMPTDFQEPNLLPNRKKYKEPLAFTIPFESTTKQSTQFQDINNLKNNICENSDSNEASPQLDEESPFELFAELIEFEEKNVEAIDLDITHVINDIIRVKMTDAINDENSDVLNDEFANASDSDLDTIIEVSEKEFQISTEPSGVPKDSNTESEYFTTIEPCTFESDDNGNKSVHENYENLNFSHDSNYIHRLIANQSTSECSEHNIKNLALKLDKAPLLSEPVTREIDNGYKTTKAIFESNTRQYTACDPEHQKNLAAIVIQNAFRKIMVTKNERQGGKYNEKCHLESNLEENQSTNNTELKLLSDNKLSNDSNKKMHDAAAIIQKAFRTHRQQLVNPASECIEKNTFDNMMTPINSIEDKEWSRITAAKIIQKAFREYIQKYNSKKKVPDANDINVFSNDEKRENDEHVNIPNNIDLESTLALLPEQLQYPEECQTDNNSTELNLLSENETEGQHYSLDDSSKNFHDAAVIIQKAYRTRRQSPASEYIEINSFDNMISSINGVEDQEWCRITAAKIIQKALRDYIQKNKSKTNVTDSKDIDIFSNHEKSENEKHINTQNNIDLDIILAPLPGHLQYPEECESDNNNTELKLLSENELSDPSKKFHDDAAIIQKAYRTHQQKLACPASENIETNSFDNKMTSINGVEDKEVSRITAVKIIQKAFREYIQQHKSKTNAIDSKDEQINIAKNIILDSSQPITKHNWYVGDEPIITSSLVERNLPESLFEETEENKTLNNKSPYILKSASSNRLASCNSIESSRVIVPICSLNDNDEDDENCTDLCNKFLEGTISDIKGEESSDTTMTTFDVQTTNEIIEGIKYADCQNSVHEDINPALSKVILLFLESEREYAARFFKESPLQKIKFSKNNEDNFTTSPQLGENMYDDEKETINFLNNRPSPTESSSSENDSLELQIDILNDANISIEKMQRRRNSTTKVQKEYAFREYSFEDPSIDADLNFQNNEDNDEESVVLTKLSKDESRESSGKSDDLICENLIDRQEKPNRTQSNETRPNKGSLKPIHTISADTDIRKLVKSVTIDDSMRYIEPAEDEIVTSSFYLDQDTSENIRRKMMAYSISEADSDCFDKIDSNNTTDEKHAAFDYFNVSTALVDNGDTSTETESTIVSAVTKLQAGARGYLARKRLGRTSDWKSSAYLNQSKASFGNAAITESLEYLLQETAAKRIQRVYRKYFRKRSRMLEQTGTQEIIPESTTSVESSLAQKRSMLQRGDALRNNSTPDDGNSSSSDNGVILEQEMTQNSEPPEATSTDKTFGKPNDDKKNKHNGQKWLAMRQNSMPVQIDSEVFRVIPKYMRKKIKSADSTKERRRIRRIQY